MERLMAMDISLRAKSTAKSDDEILVDIAKTFDAQAEAEQQAPGEDPLYREICEDSGAEYSFYLAMFKFDVENVRAICRAFWKLHQRGHLILSTAATMTNIAFWTLEKH